MKFFENRLLQRRDRNFGGQIHHLEQPIEPFDDDQGSHDLDSTD
jgi:hypothetical protein